MTSRIEQGTTVLAWLLSQHGQGLYGRCGEHRLRLSESVDPFRLLALGESYGVRLGFAHLSILVACAVPNGIDESVSVVSGRIVGCAVTD
jgi:hypothetical protein